MIRNILLLFLFLLLFSCEDRIYVEKNPDIILQDGIYILDPAGYEYTKVILSDGNSVSELVPCRESASDPAVLFSGEGKYYDMFLLNGEDTVYIKNTWIGKTAKECLNITVLDVKQGDSFIIAPPGVKPSVMDGGYGSLGEYDWQGGGVQIFADWLKEKSFYDLKYIIETHHDTDHYGGLLDVTSAGAFSFEAYLDNASSVLPGFGDTLRFGGGVNGVILRYGDVAGDPLTSDNDRSICLKLIYKDFEMIFTGDIEEDGESDILSRSVLNPAEQYEVLKVAHHGSRYSSSETFLNTVLPLYSIISSGEGNPFGHPTEEVINRLENIGTDILGTDVNSTIELYTDGKSLQLIYTK